MDILLIITRIIAFITPWALGAAPFVLIGGILFDVIRKKFYWTKLALVFSGSVILLLIIELKLVYKITTPGFFDQNQTEIQGETASWKIYTVTSDSTLGYESYQIKLPITWKRIEHTSNFQSTETFQDGQNVYQLVIEEEGNYNDHTGKPFASLRELTGLPYDVTTLVVDGQQAPRPLPRAGGEHIYGVWFFSRDTKLVYSITLETPRDGSKIQEGEALFNQILSTFKFTDPNSPDVSKTSTDGLYTVTETMLGDYNTIVVKNSSGKVITDDLIKKNEKAIGYGTKFGCQCGTSFAGWTDSSHFILKIINGNGEEYQYMVDASTGIVNESSFKKVK